MEQKPHLASGLINFTAAAILIVLTIYILVIGNAILLPLAVAIVIWYIMTRFAAVFSGLPVIGHKMPKGLAIFFAVIATLYIVYVFFTLVSSSINGIIEQAPLYQAKINQLIALINQWFHTDFEIRQLVSKINIPSLFSNLAVTLTNIASNLGVILVYVLFLGLEYQTFDGKIRAMSKSAKSLATTRAIINQIGNDINAYLRIKTGMSMLTGVLTYASLTAFAIPYAEFWALLIFVLNYIPTIGSIIAVAITLLAVSVQFTSYTTFAILAGLLIGIQLVVGNIIEPRLMGKNLNLSPLVILLSLAFWGSIWGVIGMFLCVPLMTIINIILSKFESTHRLAMMFAANPEGVKSGQWTAEA